MPFIQANDKRLEYFETGAGADDTVVLIHGASSSARIWHQVQRQLANDGFHTVAISLPGAGGSDRPADLDSYSPASYAADIRAALDALEITRFAIAGHSLGVTDVLNLASDHAGGIGIRALILMAGGNVIGRPARTPQQAREIKSRYRAPDPDTEPTRRAEWDKFHVGLPPDIRDQLWRDIQLNPKERTIGQNLATRRDMTEFANNCDIPTLITSGDSDSVVSLEFTLAMYPKFKPGLRHCHVFHGIDHYPNAEIPDKVASVYSRFLKAHQLA